MTKRKMIQSGMFVWFIGLNPMYVNPDHWCTYLQCKRTIGLNFIFPIFNYMGFHIYNMLYLLVGCTFRGNDHNQLFLNPTDILIHIMLCVYWDNYIMSKYQSVHGITFNCIFFVQNIDNSAASMIPIHGLSLYTHSCCRLHVRKRFPKIMCIISDISSEVVFLFEL